MDEEQERYVARPFTLREMLDTLSSQDVTVINEVNETLVSLSEIQFYVNKPEKILCDDLLNRKVISYAAEAGELLIKVEGMEDAE